MPEAAESEIIMRRSIAAVVAGLVLSLGSVSVALASGGPVAGGGGGGGGAPAPTGGGVTTPPTGGASHLACVTVGSFTGSAAQSGVSLFATLSVGINLSLCSGGARVFSVSVRAIDANGATAWSSTIPWAVSGSIPLVTTLTTDNMAFGSTYQLALDVSEATGGTVATAAATVSTPAQRVAGCAIISSLTGRQAYVGAYYSAVHTVSLAYGVRNCGSTETLDITAVATNPAGLVFSSSVSQVAYGSSVLLGTQDLAAPVATYYRVTLSVREHSTGLVLDSLTIAA